MKNELNKILTELSYRVKDGVPNLNNEQHLIKLFDVLKEFNWPIEARVELIQNLTESEAGDQAKKLGLTHMGFGNYGKDDKVTHTSKDGELVPVGGSGGDDSEKSEKGEKELNQKIDFNNPPESITKDIQPDDETFENQENITPHEYDPQEIEVGGQKIKLPVNEETLNKVFNQPPHKFPKKYIKTLERILNTQKIDKDNPPITSFTNSSEEREQVGAGQISAQASELLMMMSTTLSDEESDKLYELLEKTSDSTKGNQILDKSWIQASRSMREAAIKNIKEQYGPDAVVEFGGWDSTADVEDGIGISYDKKGFSTDTFFRVKVDGKSKIHEVSNKKSLVVHLANPGSGDIEDGMEKAGVDIGDPNRHAGKYTENAANRSRKRLEEINDIEVYEKLDDMNDDELLETLNNLPSEIRSNFTSGSAPKLQLKKDARNYLKMMKALKNVPKPWDTTNKEFLDAAKEAGVNLGSRVPGSSKAINKMMIYSAYLQYADELSNGVEDGPGMNFIQNQVGIIGKEPYPEGSQRDVENQHIVNLNKKESRPVLMKLIREKFPLKSLMEAEESMVLGGNRMSPEICEKIFGTTEWDKVQENISIKKNDKGEYYLTYSVKVDGKEKEIRIAQIKPRGKGKGYASITTEMSLAEEFQHTVHCANKTSDNPPKNPSDEEIKLAKKLERKYGEC